MASTPKIVEFGTATASAFVQWILDQALSAQYVRQLTFLELFIVFHFEVGMVLPIQVGVRRGSFRWLPVENSNAGALLGRTLGSQTGVIEWLVKNVFGHWGGFDVGLVMVSRPCAAIHLPLRGCTLPVSDSTVWQGHFLNMFGFTQFAHAALLADRARGCGETSRLSGIISTPKSITMP